MRMVVGKHAGSGLRGYMAKARTTKMTGNAGTGDGDNHLWQIGRPAWRC
jgi:hypothetical protein